MKNNLELISKRYLTFSAIVLCLLLLAGGASILSGGKAVFQSFASGAPTEHNIVIGDLPSAPKASDPNVVRSEATETELSTLQKELNFEIWHPRSLLGEFELVRVSKSVLPAEGPRADLRYASKVHGSDAAFTVTQSKPGITSVVSVSSDRVIREIDINGNHGVLYDMYYYLPDPKPLVQFEPYLAILTWTDGSRMFEVWGKDYDLMVKVARALEP